MLNRRKAMIGWLIYTGAKPFIKQAMKSRAKKAKDAATPGTGDSRRGAVARGTAVLAAAGAAVGGLLFWRSRRRSAPAESARETASASPSPSPTPSAKDAAPSES